MKIKAWYGPGGALITDKPVFDSERRLPDDCATFYGGQYMVGESMLLKMAEAIAKKLNLDFQGKIEGGKR